MKMNKKAQIQQLQALIIPLIGVGIVLVIGFLIFAQVKQSIQSIEGINSSGQDSEGNFSSHAFNSTSKVQDAVSTIPEFLSIIVITVIGIVLLGLVASFAAVTRGRR